MTGKHVAAYFAMGLGFLVLCYGAYGVFTGNDDRLPMAAIGLMTATIGIVLLRTGSKDKSD